MNVSIFAEPTSEGVQTKVKRGCPDVKGPPGGEPFENRCFDMKTPEDVGALIPGADSLPQAEGTSAYKIRMCDRSLCNKMDSSEPALCEELTEDEYDDVGLLKSDLFGSKCGACSLHSYHVQVVTFLTILHLIYSSLRDF